MSLRPCPKCRRHAREQQCPFCGASIASIRTAPRPRVSRAVMFATAATVAVATDCGQTNPPVDGGSSDSSTFDAVPFYGGCPACDAGSVDAGDAD